MKLDASSEAPVRARSTHSRESCLALRAVPLFQFAVREHGIYVLIYIYLLTNCFLYIEELMSETIDELSVNYVDGGVQTVKELDKVVLSKGAWTTILFRYQDWDARKEEYGPERYTIRRYQKRSGQYNMRSKFNISSRDQARQIISALQQWTQDG